MTTPLYRQYLFRGRADDVALNSGTFTYALNTNFSWNTDTTFRLRFAIQEYNNKAVNNLVLQLRYQKNGTGGYQPIGAASSIVQLVNDSQSIADHATTTKVIATGTYTTGDSQGWDDGTTDDYTGNVDFNGNDEAEVEFCIQILGTGNNNGDTFEFRVYQSSGTALNSYTQTPTVTAIKASPEVTFAPVGQAASSTPDTVDIAVERTFVASGIAASATPDTVDLTGISLVTGQLSDDAVLGAMLSFNGPVVDSEGNVYAVLHNATDFAVVEVWVWNGSNWTHCDSTNEPNHNSGAYGDVASLWVYREVVNDRLWIATMTDSEYVCFHKFRVATDGSNPNTWELTDQVVDNFTDTGFERACCLVRGDTADDWIIIHSYEWTGTNEDSAYSYTTNGTAATPTWNTDNAWDDQNDSYDNLAGPGDYGDLSGYVYGTWKRDDNDFWPLRWATDVDQTFSAVGGTDILLFSGAHVNNYVGKLIVFNDGSNEYVVAVWPTTGQVPYSSQTVNRGTPGNNAQVTDQAVFLGTNGHTAAAFLAFDPQTDELYYVFAEDTSQDIYYAKSSNYGASWANEVELLDGVSADQLSASVVVRGGNRYLFILWADGYSSLTNVHFAEWLLGPVGQDRTFAPIGQASSTTSTPDIAVTRAFTVTGQAASSTPTPIFDAGPGFTAEGLAASATPDTSVLALIKTFVAAGLAASATPDNINLTALLEFLTAGLANSTTSDIDLAVERTFVASGEAASATSTPVFGLTITFSATGIAVSVTSEATLTNGVTVGTVLMPLVPGRTLPVLFRHLGGVQEAAAEVTFIVTGQAASATSTPSLTALLEFLTAGLADSATSTPSLDRQPSFVAEGIAASVTSDAAIQLVKSFVAAGLAASTTPNIDLAVVRDFVAAGIAASTTPGVDLSVVRTFVAAGLAATTTPTPDLTLVLEFITAGLAVSATPDDVTLDVGAVVDFVAAGLAASSTSTIDLAVLRTLVSAGLASSATSSPSIDVLRTFISTGLAASSTPDNVILDIGGIVEFVVQGLAVSITPSIDLSVLRTLVVAGIAASTTPSVTLDMYRGFVAAGLAASATPDDVVLDVGALVEFIVAGLAASVTPTIDLSVVRTLVALGLAASATSTGTLDIARGFVAQGLAASATSDADLAVQRLFQAVGIAVSATPDNVVLDVAGLIEFVVSGVAASSTSVAALTLTLTFDALGQAITVTPDTSNLHMYRGFVAEGLAASATSDAAITLELSFAVEGLADSTTAAPILSLLLPFIVAGLAESVTPDDVVINITIAQGVVTVTFTARKPDITFTSRRPEAELTSRRPEVTLTSRR